LDLRPKRQAVPKSKPSKHNMNLRNTTDIQTQKSLCSLLANLLLVFLIVFHIFSTELPISSLGFTMWCQTM